MSTIFLATVIGWYLVIVGLFLLVRRQTLQGVMADFISQRSLVFLLAIITLILGLLMVVSHNIWVMGWPVIITILSWLVLIGALIRLFFPDCAIKMGENALKHPNRLIISGIIMLLIGLYLLYMVYWMVY